MQFQHIFKALADRIFIFILFLLLAPATSFAEDRWALVLGVANYTNENIPSLDNAVNDSRAVATSLNNMGFKVYYLENAPLSEINAVVGKIGQEQQNAELGLFYFAGHGLQIDGINFALPSDISVSGASSLERGALSVNDLIGELNSFGTESLVVILDACRNSPFPSQSAIGVGLALFDAPENTIVAYSTAPGAVALDGSVGNSPYTAALVTALEGGAQDIRDVLRLVRARVRLATGGIQTPWFIDNSKAPIIVRPRFEAKAPELTALVSDREISLSTTAWLTVATSADPRDLREFAELFPEDTLATVALRQLQLVQANGSPEFPQMDLQLTGADADIPGGLLSEVTACDILATGSTDILALVDPVPHDLVNTRAAMRACVEAVKVDPGNGRLLGLLARVLRLEERFDESLHFYALAAEHGSPLGFVGQGTAYRLGMGVEPNETVAFEKVREAALLGSPPARLLLGVYYREGWGVTQSFPEARRWMELSLNTGYAPAHVAFGGTYRKGLGVNVSYETALEHYQIAAVLGSSDAMNLIGRAFLSGQGVKRDVETGISWLVRSSDEGNPFAALELGRAFNKGNGVERDPDKALAYFRLSAQRNFIGAHNDIGNILWTGTQTISPNRPEAYANYIIAREGAILRNTRDSEKQLADALENINTIQSEMTAAEIQQGETVAQNWIEQYGLLDFNLVSF